VDGTGYTNLLGTPGAAYNPAWSPDGSRIAFASNLGNQVDIYIVNIDGTGLIRLTDSTQNEYAPAWSPDGDRLVFTSFENETQDNDLYIINSDGSGLTFLTSHGDEPAWAP
jgi:TolB protein